MNMIRYVVIKHSGATAIDTTERDKAAQTCIDLGLPLFYEVNSKNPMIPKGVWEIKNIQDDGGYNFEFKTWLEVQAEGCTCT